MLRRIRHIVAKEFIHVLRDRRLRAVLIIPPLFQLLVLGYAIDMDVNFASIAVMDLDRTPLSRSLLSSITATERMDVTHRVSRPRDGALLLDTGKADAYIEIPQGFQGNYYRGKSPIIQIILDGTDATFAGLLLERLSGTVGLFNARLTAGGSRGVFPAVVVEERGWFNTNLISRNFFVPGIIGLIVMIITLMLTAMAVVREREMGTLEQLLVSPIRPIELLLGKTIPFAIIAFAEVAVITAAALIVFRIPLKGSVALLFASTPLYLLSTLGAGLLISSISRTQQQAMMATFLFMLPAILLSGFAFPIYNMPTMVQVLTLLDPLRYYLVIVREIFLKGVGIEVLWPQMAALFGLGILFFGLGVAGFRRMID
jgi:ABC-2 type transport system permease protein